MADGMIHTTTVDSDGGSELAQSLNASGSHPDPIGCDFSLPLRAVYHPLGFAVEIWTNSADVLRAAAENWESFERVFPVPPVQLRIAVPESPNSQCPPPPNCRGQRNLVMFVAGAHDFAVCDLAAGFASCWLSTSAVQSRAYFRYYFLDAMALLLIEALYLAPVHAACVAFQGRGVLLCGDSGAGKSSLSFACARRGWTFVSDDASFLVREGEGRIAVGNPSHMHFRESATELFPDLKSHCPTPRINGELAIELTTVNIPEILTSSQSPIDFMVFLDRQSSGVPGLRPLTRERASAYLEQVICYGDERIRAAQKAALRDLLSANILELRYSDLDSAVRCLEMLVGTAG